MGRVRAEGQLNWSEAGPRGEPGRAGTESSSARLCLGAAGSPSSFAASGSRQRFLRLGAPPWSEPVSWPKRDRKSNSFCCDPSWIFFYRIRNVSLEDGAF